MRARRFAIPAFVVLATFLVFLPVLNYGFVNWDDDRNFLQNLDYRGLGWTQIRWMFSTFQMGQYQPLSWLSLGFDYVRSGMDPRGYHATSLVLHAANAVLVYFLGLRLLGPRASLTAGFAALAFSLHPLRVESVAWVSERRDVLSGFFYFLTILLYLAGRLRLAAAAFALSLLSKAMGVTLPFVLLILDVYPLKRRITRSVLLEKAPFFALALAAGAVNFVSQIPNGSAKPLAQYGLLSRLAVACYGLIFYLRKTVLPVDLLPLYPVPRPLDPLTYPFLLSAAAAAGLTVMIFRLRRRAPALLAAWLFYAAALAPVLGLIQFGPQLVADRYSYLACAGWALLGGHMLGLGLAAGPAARSTAALAAVLALGAMAAATRRQCAVWKDSLALWSRTLELSPDHYMAHNNIGMELAAQGRAEEARAHFAAAVEANPGFRPARLNLGRALWDRGSREEAVAHFRAVTQAAGPEPADPLLLARAHSNVGSYLWTRGDVEGARAQYREALRLVPDLTEAHNNLGVAYMKEGRFDEAAASFREALRSDPGLAAVRTNLALALSKRGRAQSPR